MMPAAGGLVNAGGQVTIPENHFWEMRNATIGADGRISKRQGLEQWGQTLKEPSPGGFQWQETFNDLSHWEQGDVTASAGFATFSIAGGTAKFTTTSVTPDRGLFLRRKAQPSDGTVEPGMDAFGDVRLFLKTNGALPAQSGTTQPNGFHIAMKHPNGASTYVFLVLDLGIYYWNNVAWTLIADTDIDDGSWHSVEIRLNGAEEATVLIDDEERADVTIDPFGTSVTLAGQDVLAIVAETNANGTYEVEVDLAQYRSSTGLIVGTPVTTLFNWNSFDPARRHLLAVAGATVYDDPDHAGVFRAVTTTNAGAMTTFAPFGEGLLFVNALMATRFWRGNEGVPPEAVPATFPEGVYLATQHQGRCAVVTEDRPLRVHVSAANSLEDWTTEDVVGTSESFFFDLPEALGERITFILGDHYGQLVVQTRSSVHVLAGTDINTYALRLISSKVGCEGPRAADRTGGDLLHLSRHGLHSLQGVQEFGDLSAKYVSVALRNLWQNDSFFGLPKVISSFKSSVVHAPQLGRTFVAVQTQEGSLPTRVYELNHDVGRWTGPWEMECEAMTFTLLGTPPIPVLMTGDTEGRVAMVHDDRKFDFEADAYNLKLRTARMDGRSLDPALVRRTKRWIALKLFVLPRGGWDISVTARADGHDRPDEGDYDQNVYREALLNSTFVLNASEIVDAEKVGVVTIPFDLRGRWLELTIEQGGSNEDLVIIGAEVDFVPAQDDVENK